MNNEAASLMQALTSARKVDRERRKSDDILAFIRSHPSVFGVRPARMEAAVSELEQRFELTPTQLCDALGVPDCVMFKKVKVVDTAELVLRFARSPLLETFVKARDAHRERSHDGLVVFLVAGEHTMVITDMPCEQLAGHLNMTYLTDSGDQYCVFPYKEAHDRLKLFRNLKEGDYE